ncbi:hypothetical protein [Burkholderia glumae]|uniref:Uncharacterized protein n=1 Tax=Burkholderia glumae TaxID=337 RepID=A0AAP9Y6T2_BURGL|nr:hypothetical protein [Burkholderia glumae]AJY62560.1 hypothetical protein KS03_5725 [Burkholderia glumae LMG 2196 = ATCC 33617]PNL04107.1 hypothetical protein CEQ24_012170 [Burkholderia glumae]QGA41624.1 hypothetical protein GAS19_29450 [Burkholderia glumae]QPQ94789.1 hypothetical protein I6H06_29725 [Burkholderia glumae]QQM89313.1 hypothetical protein I6G78_00010 [Burkholderia glumae]
MDALKSVAEAATSGKSLKRRNMLWLIAVGIVDVVALSLVVFHQPLSDFTVDKMAAMRVPLSVLLPAPILALSYLLSQSQKATIVFWRLKHPMPGSRAFSVHAPADVRIDLDALRKNVGEFPVDERAQNAMWYRLYKLVQDDTTVLESHQNFLMLRDVASMSLLLVVLAPIALALAGVGGRTVAWCSLFFLAQYILTAIASRNNGVRFVQNVLAIHATKKVATAKPATPRKTKASEAVDK